MQLAGGEVSPELGLLLINLLLAALLAMHARADAARDREIHKLRKRLGRHEVLVAKLKERLKGRA